MIDLLSGLRGLPSYPIPFGSSQGYYLYIRLFQALPKGDKLDTIIQKAVECGASEIIPFQSDRCVVRIKDASEDRKNERRRRIATEAAKQRDGGVPL